MGVENGTGNFTGIWERFQWGVGRLTVQTVLVLNWQPLCEKPFLFPTNSRLILGVLSFAPSIPLLWTHPSVRKNLKQIKIVTTRSIDQGFGWYQKKCCELRCDECGINSRFHSADAADVSASSAAENATAQFRADCCNCECTIWAENEGFLFLKITSRPLEDLFITSWKCQIQEIVK
jgi:hypothetical protein